MIRAGVYIHTSDLIECNSHNLLSMFKTVFQALRPSEPEAPTGYIGSKFDVPVGAVPAESSRSFVLKGLR